MKRKITDRQIIVPLNLEYVSQPFIREVSDLFNHILIIKHDFAIILKGSLKETPFHKLMFKLMKLYV